MDSTANKDDELYESFDSSDGEGKKDLKWVNRTIIHKSKLSE